MDHFPSRYSICCGIIRSYENKTCEIPLLSGSNLSFRSSKEAMFFLQKNLVNSAPKTWTSKRSYPFKYFKPGFFRKVYLESTGSTATWSRFVGIPPQISADATAFYRWAQSSKNTFWATDFVSRWSLVPLLQKTVDFISRCIKILLWKNSHLFGSAPSSRQRRSF